MNYNLIQQTITFAIKIDINTLLMRITVELENIAVLKEKTEVLNLVYVI